MSQINLIVTDDSYIPIAENWLKFSQCSDVKKTAIACTGKTALEHFSDTEHTVLDYVPDIDYKSTEKKFFSNNIIQPHDRAAHAAVIRITALLELFDQYDEIIYSDVDALWLKDPWVELKRKSCDIAFQIDFYPYAIRDKWGFAANTGFLYFRKNQDTVNLLQRTLAIVEDVHDEQVAFNYALDEFVNWPSKKLGMYNNSFVRPLPRTTFTRHKSLEHNDVIVYHPQTEMGSEYKQQAFEELGLWRL